MSILIITRIGGLVRAFAGARKGVVKHEYRKVLPRAMNLRDIPLEAVSDLEKIPGVERVVEDRYYPDMINLQQSIPLINGLQSQIETAGMSADGSGVRICICDTGVDADHIMYADRYDASASYDIVNDDDDPDDDHGHGTHVAGIALVEPGFHLIHAMKKHCHSREWHRRLRLSA